jgi:aspartyl-tRNA(Asn)/glutamyl-tRNA(Gln) amidotransferase subunit A
VPLAIGTDTAGSVRIPAALCGVVGAKPSRDTLPTGGVFPLSPSLDHVGVLAGTVADARYAVDVLSGSRSAPLRRPRFGVLDHAEPSAEVAAAFRAAVAALDTVKVRLPDWDPIRATGSDIQEPEAAAVHAETIEHGDYQPAVRELLRTAAEVPGWRYVLAKSRVAAATAAIDEALRGVDALLLPTVPIVAPPLNAADVREPLLRYTRPPNVTGHPAISVPLATRGLPVGLQVIAADNGTAFAAAEWVTAPR